MENIFISDIKVRPYGPNCDLTHHFPLVEAFDHRRDFILFRNLEALAVLFEMSCLDNSDRRQAANARYTVLLMDTTNGCVISSERLHVCINPWDGKVYPRVDLPLISGLIDTSHEHQVWVMNGWRDQKALHDRRRPWLPAYTCMIGFHCLKRLPRRYYDRLGAWIEDGHYRLRNAILSWHGEVHAVFAMRAVEELRQGHLPEFWVHVVAADGSTDTLPARYRMPGDGTGQVTTDFEVDCEIDLNYYPKGVLYIELRQFNTCIASITIDTSRRDIDGRLTADETDNISDYTPARGLQLIKSRMGETDTEEGYEVTQDEDDFEQFVFGDDDDDTTGMTQQAEPVPAKQQTRERLDNMVGLHGVKSHVESFSQLMAFSRMREQAGLAFPALSKHALFLGAPGTGKTTVANIMGDMLHELGVLSIGHVVVRERSMFVGNHYGDEEERTREALEEAKGGILFIDEAYQLHQPSDPKDPGHFVLDTLMTALADEGNRDWMLIMAGYTRPMLKMLELNPGLSSRLPATNHYYFEDYSPTELAEIARRYLASQQFALTADADAALLALLEADCAAKGDDFGNARHVLNILQTQVLPRMANRVTCMHPDGYGDKPLLQTIEAADIPQPACRPLSRTRRTIGFCV